MPTRVLFLLISHVTHGYNAVRGHMTGSDNSRAEEYLCVCVRACVRVCVLCVVCVCVRMKPFFLVVYIQHTQCPRWFLILAGYKLCGHKPRKFETHLRLNRIGSTRNTMILHK